ncbi:regucalcin-like [Haliotis rubra]|uniref:regucalcin-like n=1 Tax=Haliotis rubra TaxID=36100 RepID=UPI001EE60FB5|nr:regucalcin-like [Haliotis rubra]
MSENIEVVVRNCDFGEGPHWDDTTQCLYYVDVFANDVHKYNAVTGEDAQLNLGGGSMATVIIPRQKGGFVVSQKTDLAIVDSWDSGKVTSIAKVEADANTLNDGKVDASGRLWIGSCPNENNPDLLQLPKYQASLSSLDADGSVRKHISNISLSNGMDWTDDNSVMYYIDSIPRQVWAFDFDITAGTISNKRTVADFSSTEIPDMGFPDGMAVDTEGKLWVACFDAGKIVRIDPETGKVIRTVKFPCEKTTSCCFGGEDFTDLYVTSAAPAQLEKTSLGGSLFKVTGLGVRGRKANMFAG